MSAALWNVNRRGSPVFAVLLGFVIEKVTGRARYTADLPLGATLVGRIGRSPVAHAVIRGIDVSRALAIVSSMKARTFG